MTTTPRLGAPELVSGQATPETTVNEQIRYVEQGASYFIVKDKDLATPPGSPADGDAYIIASSPTGAWSGKADKIAFYVSTAWDFITAIEGTKAYVQDEDSVYTFGGSSWTLTDISSLSWKQAVRVASTANGTLASAFENGDTVDGVVLATGDRILLKNQSTGAENGIYTVNASGAPTRAVDADTGVEMLCATVTVSEGTTNADTTWVCTTNAPITLGSTALTFVQSGSSGPASASEVWTGSATNKYLSPANLFTSATPTALTSSATITPDFNAGFNFSLTLATNATLANASNQKVGQSGIIVITQDGTGSRTLAYGTNWKFPGGAPVLSTAAGSIDVLTYYVSASSVILCNLTKAYS